MGGKGLQGFGRGTSHVSLADRDMYSAWGAECDRICILGIREQ